MRRHLVALSDGAVVEAEEVYELIEELADADGGYLHRAAQSLRGTTKRQHRQKKRLTLRRQSAVQELHSPRRSRPSCGWRTCCGAASGREQERRRAQRRSGPHLPAARRAAPGGPPGSDRGTTAREHTEHRHATTRTTRNTF